MHCKVAENCGGCVYRSLSQEIYRQQKTENFKKILTPLGKNFSLSVPIFIDDSTRRRAALTFRYVKKKLTLGFNENHSDKVIDLDSCPLLTARLNNVLPDIRRFIASICAIPYTVKKGKKLISQHIVSGDVWLCEAQNGIDVVLEYDAPLELNHRMELFEQVQSVSDIIRLSHRRHNSDVAEPIIEKAKPFIKIGNYDIYIPAGTFLQPSAEGQNTLTELVKKYLGDTEGRIADLFCGVGTFSYVLAGNIKNKITAVDSSVELLRGFRESVNANQIPNIEINLKNLFKYPLDAKELKDYVAVLLDPPRAGAAAQVKQLAELEENIRPQKIIMVSCNPNTFVNDAKCLIDGGYILKEVTMVDQFVYSNHSELVALFTKKQS
ncbi:MAG: class I SAM-dependent RNA methyltransferase [Alphaproteobacteria bacterium]|nr:class I SAM-dependent RNA methyltransferase [Alphaproteobacteria bacterium]